MIDDETENHWVWGLREMGFRHLFPLGSPGENPPSWLVQQLGAEKAREQWPKTPRMKWKEYQTRPPTDDEIRSWIEQWPDCNFGLCTGQDIDVIDADSEEAVQFVRSALTHTPWMVRTGKGAHFYFCPEANRPFFNTADGVANLDTRGKGGYVVAPGSTHHNGRVYNLTITPGFESDRLSDLPQISNADIEKIKSYKDACAAAQAPKAQQPLNGTQGNIGPFDANHHQVVEQGVPEGGRNNHMSRMVGKWISDGFGLDDVMAKALAINEENNPPLPQSEVLQVVKSVQRTHMANRMAEGVIVAPKPDPSPQTLLMRPSELHVAPPAWLIKQVLPKTGVGVLFGPSGGGKSFVSLDMCLSIAAGRDWHGNKVKQGAVIYACGEGLEGIANRLRAWEQHTGVSIDSLPIRITRRPVRFLDRTSTKELMDAIEGEIVELGGKVQCICVDTLNRNFGDGDENSTKDMTRFISALDEVRERYACVAFIVHHTGHAEGDRARGSSALRASIDFEIQLKVTSRAEDFEKTFTLVGKKMKDGRDLPEMGFKLATITLGVDEDGDEFGSCVIEQAQVVDVAGNADRLTGKKPTGRPNKGLELIEPILDRYIERAKGNQHTGAVVVDRTELVGDLAPMMAGSKNKNRPIESAIKRGWLIDKGQIFEVTKGVES